MGERNPAWKTNWAKCSDLLPECRGLVSERLFLALPTGRIIEGWYVRAWGRYAGVVTAGRWVPRRGQEPIVTTYSITVSPIFWRPVSEGIADGH